MDIKQMLGDSYKEGMTLDELLKALETLPEPEKPSEDVVKKDQFDKVASELAKYKKLAKQADSDKQTLEEKLKEELETTRLERAKAKAEGLFSKAGLTPSEEFIGSVVTSDVDGSVNRVNGIIQLLEETRASAREQAKAELLAKNPKPDQEGQSTKKLPNDLSKMSLDDLNVLYESNPSLFDEV